MYVSNYAVKFKVQADIDSVAGYPLVQVILRKSMDYQTWTNLDTLTVSEATESAISTVIEPYTPYLDIQATATDSVQTSKLTYTILIEKNP